MLSGQNKVEEFDIFLEDIELGKMHDLKLSPSYSFYSDAFNDPDRFLLHFSPIITGIQQEEIDESVHIYSWNKAIYVKPQSGQNIDNALLQVFDMYGRKILERPVNESQMLRVPVAVNNTYLVVKLIQQGNIVVKKVFVQ